MPTNPDTEGWNEVALESRPTETESAPEAPEKPKKGSKLWERAQEKGQDRIKIASNAMKAVKERSGSFFGKFKELGEKALVAVLSLPTAARLGGEAVISGIGRAGKRAAEGVGYLGKKTLDTIAPPVKTVAKGVGKAAKWGAIGATAPVWAPALGVYKLGEGAVKLAGRGLESLKAGGSAREWLDRTQASVDQKFRGAVDRTLAWGGQQAEKIKNGVKTGIGFLDNTGAAFMARVKERHYSKQLDKVAKERSQIEEEEQELASRTAELLQREQEIKATLAALNPENPHLINNSEITDNIASEPLGAESATAD